MSPSAINFVLHVCVFLFTFPSLGKANAYIEVEHGVKVPEAGGSKCFSMPYKFCKSMKYNFTGLPNIVAINTPAEVEYSLNSFKPLVKYRCSSQLTFLLCSIYAPVCSPQVNRLIGPCQGVCQEVRARCAPVLKGFGLPWPSSLNCSALPIENNEEHMCMQGPGETVPLPLVQTIHTRSQPISMCSHLARPQLYTYVSIVGRCAPLCHAHILFTGEDKSFALVWMSLWSVVTFFMGGLTAASVLVRKGAFKYPERAAVNICLSYSLVALGYIVRLAAGNERISCWREPELGISVGITQGVLTTSCVFVFLLLYFFTMSAGVWWLILCILWMLRSWKHLTHEVIMPFSSILHAVGWGVPTVLTIACLVFRRVEADELTGTCLAGGHNLESLVHWVVIPHFLFISVGATLVLVSFACVWRKRRQIKKGLGLHKINYKGRFQKLEIETVRIGIISTMYMVPAMSVLGVTFYELRNYETWMATGARPSVEAYLLKIFMAMSPGLLISLFMLNAQALDAWKGLYYRVKGKTPSNHHQRGLPLSRGEPFKIAFTDVERLKSVPRHEKELKVALPGYKIRS